MRRNSVHPFFVRLGPVVLLLLIGLVGGASDALAPWKERARDEVARLDGDASAERYRSALDALWRADEWWEAVRVARAALERHPEDAVLRARAVRAFWRGGLLAEAEGLLAKVRPDSSDPVSCLVHVDLPLARGDNQAAAARAADLEQIREPNAEIYLRQFAVRLARGEMRGLAELVRRAMRVVDVANGYPDVYAADMLDGLSEFLEQIGEEPVNQLAEHGEAPMPPLPLVNLPSCEVLINGRGPYRLIVDTGGSVMIALDDAVAEEIGLKSLGQARVRGVSGVEASQQALIDELKIGGITCRRVMTRVFGVRKAAAGLADGILGTGIFHEGRMMLDLQQGRLRISPSSTEPAAGRAVEARLIGDAKIIAPVTLNGAPAVAFFDSGADVVAFAPSRLERLFPGHQVQPLDTGQLGLQLGVGSSSAPQISLNPGVDLVVAGRSYARYSGLGLDVLDNLLSPILGVQCDALIGMAVFRDMRSFTIDYPTVRLWIDWRE